MICKNLTKIGQMAPDILYLLNTAKLNQISVVIITKKIHLLIHKINSQYYFKILSWGSQNLAVPAAFLADSPNLRTPVTKFCDNNDV